MKRILFILSMLIGVAYGQSVGYWRYDTVVLQKIGGNSELKVMNATRGITGGVLTNMGNGRTAFVTPAATTKAKSGTTLSGDTVILGGTTLDRYSAIGLNGFPLSIINNSVDTTTQSDSNSLRLFNRALATSATSAKVSPRFQLGFQGWKTSGGASSVPMWFGWDAYGRSVNPGGGGILRLQSSSNGTIRTLYTITEAGQFQQSLISNGRYFGFAGTGDVIGGSSLSLANSSGSFNVAISNAMANSAGVTGDRNMGAGSASLSLLTSGSFNNAYGYGSLEVNTSASLNSAFGYNAMKANTTGEQNAAFGANALTANTTAIKNTAMGTAALEETTTGGFNTAIGHDAMLHNTTGTDNTGIGWLGWAQNITGSYNIGIGNNSGQSILNGTSNVFIGAESGYLDTSGVVSQNDTVNNSMAFGRRSYTTASNQIWIGNGSHNDLRAEGIVSGAGTRALRYDPSTKKITYGDTTSGGGGSQGLQDVITVDGTLTGDNTIVNGANTLTVTNNTLANSWGTIFSSSSTAAIATQTMLLSSLTGTNANSSVQSIGIRGDVARDGTGSINYGVYGSASQGATSNTAVWGQATDGVTAIGGLFEASGATNNYAVQLVDGTEGVGKVLTSDATGKASWATPSGGGITVGTTTITSGTSTRVAFNNAGVYGEDAGLTFNPTTNVLTVTGPSADLANGPKMNYNFNSDANPALSYFFYTHDNLAITLDSYYNGGWVSSDAGSNFLLYKNAGELKIGYNAGTAAGSSFSPNLTDGVRFTNNGRLGIGVAATAKLHLVASTTAANTASIKVNEGSRQTTPEDGTINYVANNLEFAEGAGPTVYILAKTLTATATLNFDLTAVNSQDLTITVTGAASGDAVSLGLDPASVAADITFFGWVSAANTVTVRCSRVGGGGAADPASGTFRASVIKY